MAISYLAACSRTDTLFLGWHKSAESADSRDPEERCIEPQSGLQWTTQMLYETFVYLCFIEVCTLQTQKDTTVEPRHTTIPLIRPTRYYDHFLWPEQKPTHFLIWKPRYYDQRPPFGVPSRCFLYKITPLIRPVKMFGESAEWKQTQSDKQWRILVNAVRQSC